MAAGSSSTRTTTASMTTVRARISAASLTMSVLPVTKPRKTTVMTSAIEVRVLPERCSPSSTARLLSYPSCQRSLILPREKTE